ncbi:DoxX family protein [Lewinella sp. IMCC34183]|uniref:DoxX family protein n=1 Tax=Lewinella sp. IMCC34183 TaxID=2248762 RepID=UPI000E22B5FA|nr:DoxX family protein [Lewinella sp. IMCC34183]
MTKGNIDVALLFLRVWFGLEMAFAHGWPKMMKVFAGNFEFGDPIGVGPTLSLILAAVAEFVCGVLIALGLFTRLATIPYIITMLVAALLVHYAAGDPWGRIANPLNYAVVAIAILIAGPGRLSLDHKLFVDSIK